MFEQDVFEIAKRVKKGAKLLDKKVPKWRSILRKHKDQFDFADGDCCVLGTLEHYNGLKALGRTPDPFDDRFNRAAHRLNLHGKTFDYGFDFMEDGFRNSEEISTLNALWRAEFEV